MATTGTMNRSLYTEDLCVGVNMSTGGTFVTGGISCTGGMLLGGVFTGTTGSFSTVQATTGSFTGVRFASTTTGAATLRSYYEGTGTAVMNCNNYALTVNVPVSYSIVGKSVTVQVDTFTFVGDNTSVVNFIPVPGVDACIPAKSSTILFWATMGGTPSICQARMTAANPYIELVWGVVVADVFWNGTSVIKQGLSLSYVGL